MIEEKAVVVGITGNSVVVEASRNSACGQCASKSGCGQSSVAQWAASKMVNISVENPNEIAVSIGDDVIVGINEQSFLKASLLLYLVPLLIMFAVGFLMTSLHFVEPVVILSSFVALLSGFYLIKIYTRRLAKDSAYQLTLLSVSSL